jgi:hypothetical protein
MPSADRPLLGCLDQLPTDASSLGVHGHHELADVGVGIS